MLNYSEGGTVFLSHFPHLSCLRFPGITTGLLTFTLSTTSKIGPREEVGVEYPNIFTEVDTNAQED